MTTATDRLSWSDLRAAMTVDLPEQVAGPLSIERFTVGASSFENFRLGARATRAGTYTAIRQNGRLWMSDTDAEKNDHLPVLIEAQRVGARRLVVNGLGLGMLVKGALALPTVEHIDVVEGNPDLAALVGPHYEASGRVTVHVADAYEQMKAWPAGTRWDVGWSDIWPDLCTDNLADMARLNRSYGRRCSWHQCWGQDFLRDRARQEKAQEARWH